MNKKLALVAMLALVGLLAAGCMGSSNRSARTAAIGSSTPVTGQASLTFTSSLGTQPAFAVQKWAWGLSVQSSLSSGGLTAGKLQFKEFTITKNIDNVSPTLYKLAAMGTHLSTMTFKVGTLLTYTFANAVVTGIDQSGSAADGNEDVSFVYSKLTTANAASGTTTSYCFDAAAYTSC
jgi:type VI protein secretion system component Hcp